MNESNLFQGAVVFVIGNVDQKVLEILKNGKASFSKFTLDKVTHVVVGETFDESQVQEARELYEKPTVTEQWVLASAKLGKLAPVRPYDPITAGKLFHNFIFTMYQIDVQDRLKLFAMITLHGGTVQKELDNKVTHLLCGSSQSVAMKVASLTKTKLTIVTPDWVIDCLRLKKIVDADAFHPNLLITPTQPSSKITLMPATGIREEKSLVRTQLQQNIRQPRPTVQSMQHTPQQINEIIQSQIQQQQMQEKAKQRAAAASTSSNQNSQSPINQEPSTSNPVVPQKTMTPQQILAGNSQVSMTPNQVNQAPLQQGNQVNLQRQISLQQIEANARNQKIQLISQQLQQSTQNQLLAQQQQQQQFKQLPMVNSSPQQGNIATNSGQQFGNQQGNQHFSSQPHIKQIINPGQAQSQQSQQFTLNQNAPGGSVKSGIGQQQSVPNSGNYIQIIQQGQQIIQIQNPEGQIQQKVINQQHQNQPTTTAQITTNSPNQQPSSNIQLNQGNQQQQQLSNMPNQGNRQNIVIINQVQNPQGMNQMSMQNQRFPGISQGSNQLKNQIGPQQIIHQKIISSGNEAIMQAQLQGNTNQQSPQILQVQQGPQQQSPQIHQQNVVEHNIMIDQKLQGVPNVLHIQQTQQSTQGLTQAQAVQQIAQQLQSGSAEIISNSMNTQQLVPSNQQQLNQQMNIIQSPVHQGSSNSGNQSPQVPQSPQQWIPQSPTQPQSPVVQQTVQHHIITTNQGGAQGAPGGQFIRATGQRLGHIYLDAQSSIQFQRMDQTQRQEYLEQLHNKQQQQAQQRGVMFQQRPNAPNVIGPNRPQHHIVIRSQVPPGLTPQQQMQWLQQNQRRQIVIRPGPNQGGLAQLPQAGNQNSNIAQFQIDPNATPQQQQIQRQHFQRLQQLNQNQKMQSGPPTPNSPRGPGFPGSETIENIQQQMPMDSIGVSSAKTKTALANMLSTRLGNNGNVAQIVEQPGVDQSAAGTLRMMTAQHNAALNVQGMPPGAVRNQQELIVLQQQQSQIVGGQAIAQGHPQMQQRRSLGNIANSPGAVPSSPVIVTTQIPQGPQVMMPQSPSSNRNAQAPFSPGRAPAIPSNRAQFYGHNPNLKLPPELFLLGCHFMIVEYDKMEKENVDDWKQSIKNHGGEIENLYNVKVTHVLCRTQKHGIVMQAIRDNKRCVTVYWLNDIILKKQVLPPWQAIHLPYSSVFGSIKPGIKHIITIMGFENDERERVKRMVEESGAKLTTYMNRQNTVMVCKRQDQSHKKYIHAKEYNIPMVNVVWLSDLLLGNTSTISQFEASKYQQYNLQQPLRIDHSIVPQLMNAWKSPINLTQEAHERVKRSQLEPSPVKTKKMRTIAFLETIPDEIICIRQPEPNNIPIVMFSQVDNIESLSRAVTLLGGRVTNDHNEATHLVMTQPSRTLKLLYALCQAKYIIRSAWLEESAKAGYLLAEDGFWLTDMGSSYKCNIPAVVKSPVRKTLFENRVFFITPSVVPGPSFLKWLIEKCGGKWEVNRRSVMKIHELNQINPNSYIIISCPEDLHLLGFKHFVCYVCTSEFILQSIMTQEIDFLKSELQLTR